MSASNKRPVAGSRSPARSNTSADAARWTRMGLLGSTALIAASLAVSPAFAQTTIASPAGGGTITRTGGSSSTTDQTGSGGGVLISNVTQAAAITVNGVTINNTTGAPTIDALRIQGETSTLNSGGALLTGTNLLTTTTNGGSALYVTANGNVGVTINSSGSVFTGSYGVNIQAPSGYIDFNSVNQSQSFIGNGTHIAGLNAVSAVNASLRLGSSTFTGFDTGINASNFFGSFVELTGGSINALITGIRTDATGGGSTIESQAAIVAPTGIHSTNTNGTTITTSGAGTINSTGAGTGTGIIATSSGGTTAVTVNVGAAIGTTTAHGVGVLASTTGTSTGAINITTTAAIVATGRAISATAGTFGNTGAITLGGNVTGATGVYTNVGNYTVGIGAGVTVTSTGNGSSNAALYLVNGTNTVTNNGSLVASGTGSHGVHFSSDGLVTNTATGTITGSTGIWYQNVASVINAGTITGNGATGTAGVYGSSGVNVTNTGTITGYDGVYSGGNPTVHTNTGGTITGVSHGYNITGGRVTLTNTGVINTVGGTGGAGLSGLRLNTSLTQTNTITNSGAITGGGDATHGYGVEVEDGILTLTNQSGGVITGGIGGILISSDDLATLNLNLGSTVTGQLLSASTGARTVTVAGLLDGAYNAATGSGVDTLTLASTGSITGAVTLGAGEDVFNWQGGTFASINGGTGSADAFNSALGVGVSGSLDLGLLSNFDTYNHQSGNLTLTGTRATGAGWTLVPGSNLTLDGSLTATTGTGYGITMNGNGSPATVAILTGATLNGYVGVWFNTGGANNFSNAGTVTGSNTGVLTNGALTSTNTGTVTAGTGGAFSFGFSTSNLTNTGTVTGGSDATTGFGVLAQYAGATVTNNAGTISGGAGGISSGSIQGATYGGLLTVTNAAGAEISGAVAITTGGSSRLTLNNTGRVLGGANGGVVANGSGSPVSITNFAGGQIVASGGYAIFSATAATINNAGLIGGGTVDGGGAYTASGDNNAIRLEAASTVINSGTITGGSGGGIRANAALNLTNTSTGIINGLGTGLGTSHGVSVVGAATILNAGSITGTQANAAGVYTNGASTVTNAAGGVLGTTGGYGVYFNSGAGTFNNYGTVTGDLAAFAGVFGAGTLNLFAGSVTGAIETGGFNDTLSIYNGTGTLFAGLTDGGSGITLQTAGANAAATVGTVNLGGGTDTLQLRGAGDDSSANGAGGALDLGGSTINTAEVLTKLDNGTWTLTGAAAVPGMTINAGMGGSAGLLIFSGTGLTGDINVNGATVRATTTTAFGAGTLHMIDPTIQFAAAGTYANDISLEVVNGQQANDPTWLRNISGGTITLSGRIYETAGVGGANQYVTFDGGTTILSNTGNIWGGVTTINAGTTLQGATNTISGGSIANAGALVFNQNVDGTFVGNISGAGTLQINAPSQAVTLSGVNTFSGATAITAGTLIASGGSAIGDTSAVTVSTGATLQLANSETIGSLAGAGTARVLGNTLTLGGNNTSTTFSGSITDQTPVAYVGSWNVAAGPNWSTNPPTYTGQEAAALLFGGAAGDYRISTAGTSTSTITDTAWYNRYGGSPANFTELAVNARIDTGGAGYNNQGDSSAYVGDHTGTPTFNYAFVGGVALGGGLTKTGTGTLTLSGVNNYTGLTSITGGTLVVQNGAAISNLSTVNILSPGAFSVASTETIASLTGTGATTIASGQTLTLASGAGTYTGDITGGSLVLASGSWTYGGLRSGGDATGVVLTGSNTTLNIATTASVLSGQYNGVRLNGTNTTLTNLGLIQNAGTGGDGAVGAGVFVIDAAGTTTTINNGSVSDTGAGSTIRGYNAGIRHDNSALGTLVVNNYGRVLGDVYNGIENTNGVLTLNNFAGGEIYTLVGNGVSSASAGAVTVTNAGVIGRDIANTQTVGGYGVVTNGALTLVNQVGGLITGSLGGVSAASSASITNAGSIMGAGAGSYGVLMTAGGSVTNQSGGSITGVSGGILLSGATAFNLNLQAGSTTGIVRSTASGTVTTTVAGSLTGAYVATGAGVDNLTLAAAGSMTSASLGAGADSFVYQGGAFSGLVDAGTGTDGFISALGAGSASVNLSNLVNFETFAHQSGTLTLTGTGAFSGGASVQGSLIVNGTLQAAASIANGATLSGGGSITGAVTVASGATLIGAQGATLTMGSLALSSGSTLNATFSGAGGPALFAVTGALTLDGTVNVASTGAYGFGVYGLMTYGGALTDNGLVIGPVPGGAQRVLVQTSVAGQVNIVHAPTELLFWDGGAVGQHDNGSVNGGSGIWTAAGSEWTDANGAFNGAMEPQPGFAIFQGAGGVVTVDNGAGAVSVTGMQFAADGYRIEGDAVTLANASTTIRVGDGTAPSAAWTATIASALTGAGGLVKTDLGTLILAGENTYSGGATINAGTLQVGDGAAAGSIVGSVVNNAALVFARSDNHDFANAVSGSGTVGVSGVVTLSGAITATPGVTILDGSSLTSTGVITASNAVTFANGGTFTNAGTVNGAVVKNGAAAGTVTNAGAINGLVQNVGAGLLTIDNQAGGSIIGAGAAAVLSTATGAVSLNNAGDISHALSAFVSNNALDSVTNSGRIVAGSITGGVVTAGGNDAIRLNVGGSVTNQAGGLITGTHGVASYAGLLTLDNQLGATIAGVDYGVRGYAAANIVNAGVIGATDYAGIALGAGGTITNSGTIGGGSQAGANHGVTIDGAMATTIVNQAGGVINNGVANFGSGLLSIDIQAGSTVNGGIFNFSGGGGVLRIAGALNGTYAGSSAADAITLVSGGAVSGILQGNGGVDSFELAGAGAGTVNIGNVLGFESRTMNGAGVWTLTGFDNSTTGWSINSGTLAVSGGAAINDAVSVTIAAPGALRLNASERIGALNGSGAVALGSSTLTVGGAGASSYAGVIGGSGGVTVTGGGLLTLSGANTYTGATTASGATLRLGGSNVLADATNLTASFGGVVDMGTFSDTVATSTFFTGTRLDGTGTLTAGSYTSYGAVFNANLGAGTLYAVGGLTTLNGAVGTGQVFINGGTLSLGASDRLADTAMVSVSSGSRLELNAFNETVGVLTLNGLLNGTGTLSAAQYALNGGTVNANLGSGALFSIGSSTLNGTAAAGQVAVNGGTLTLGSSNRLADGAAVTVASGATLALGGFADTVGTIDLAGVLAGTGTLTAGTYTLSGGVVNANLGTGLLIQQSGVSTLNGMSGSGQVSVNAGTLDLGAANRLADTAIVSVASGATLNLNAFDDTVGLALLNGTLGGTGTLTAGEYDLNGATINANLGAGNLFNVGGVSILTGSSAAANVVVQAGTLDLGASNRLADTATVLVASGSTLNLNNFDDTVGLALLNGVLAGTGTLAAGEYDLNGAVISANLGAGNLFNTAGVSTLNGTSGASGVVVQAGTLTLGASNRLADTATVSVASGSILNLGAFNDTVGLAVLNGTLAGTGTLTAAQYQLNAAVVNANLGAGALFNLGGGTILTGTAAANQVSIDAGTLRLGASERLSDAATVWVATAASFNVNGFNERIGALFGTGDVNVGAGRLTFGGVESGFGGRLSGTGSVVHTGGLFTLMGDHTIASISNTGGELRFLGATTGSLSASGGSVTGAGTIGGALTASNGAVLSPGLAGVQNGIGGFTAGGLTLNGGTLAIDVLGKSGGNLIDQLRINGAATLTGGLLVPTFQGGVADFDFSTRYLFLQANNLVGTFANGANFTAAGQEGLFWRVRYDLSPNGAVLELRELTGFDPGATGTGNQRSVGQALSGGQLAASDDFAGILGLIAGLNAGDRAAAFDSISGEPLADMTSSLFGANDSFLTAVRDGGLGGRDDGGEALNFVDGLSFAGGRDNVADRLGDVLGAFDPSASTARGAGGWVSAYAGDQTLDGKPGQATVDSRLNGFAGGYGVRNGSVSIGAAGGVSRLEGDVAARDAHYESDLSHAAAYVAFDDGAWATDVTATFYGGDLDSRRGVRVGAFGGQAIGNTHVEGQALSASVARRFQVSDNAMIALGAIGTASNASVDGFTETGAGGLSLQASGLERDWQSLQLSARATQDYRVDGRGLRIYAGAGVLATTGDRQATGDMRFTGAPTGFGAFTIEGAETPPLAGVADFGLEVGVGEGITLSAGYRGLFSERLQDNQVGVKLKASW